LDLIYGYFLVTHFWATLGITFALVLFWCWLTGEFKSSGPATLGNATPEQMRHINHSTRPYYALTRKEQLAWHACSDEERAAKKYMEPLL
jgi:hypothetical protein